MTIIERHFTFNYHTDPRLAVPSPAYLKMHALCCEVAMLSGAGEYLDRDQDELEGIRVLVKDGSSAPLLSIAKVGPLISKWSSSCSTCLFRPFFTAVQHFLRWLKSSNRLDTVQIWPTVNIMGGESTNKSQSQASQRVITSSFGSRPSRIPLSTLSNGIETGKGALLKCLTSRK